MFKKTKQTLEERLLSPKEIDEKISELQKMKLMSKSSEFKPKEIKKNYDFNSLADNEIFDYQSFYEVSDIRNSTVYYLNGVQVAALFGMNEEYKKQFAQKITKGQAQLDDKLIAFYYREVK